MRVCESGLFNLMAKHSAIKDFPASKHNKSCHIALRSPTQTHNVQLQHEEGKFFPVIRSHSFVNLKPTNIF